jgi:hypothetical protein
MEKIIIPDTLEASTLRVRRATIAITEARGTKAGANCAVQTEWLAAMREAESLFFYGIAWLQSYENKKADGSHPVKQFMRLFDVAKTVYLGRAMIKDTLDLCCPHVGPNTTTMHGGSN